MSKPLTSLATTAIALVLGVSTVHGAFVTESCLAKKRKAHGKLQHCRATEEAKALQGKPADPGKCIAKFQQKIAQLSEKADEAGIGCRYRDNGNGTVTDYDTGLQWEKKVSPGGGASDPHDVDNTYTWSTGGTTPNGTVFTGFLPRLNNCSFAPGVLSPLPFAGHCDWRLPTLSELQTILLASSPCGTSPCIDPIFGPTHPATATDLGLYWSSTTHTNDGTSAWNVNFANGNVNDDNKTFDVHVRAVRRAL